MGTHTHTVSKRIMSIACNMKSKPQTVSRKAWRRARALEQARSHETRIANKGKPSKRARVAEAMENERKEVQKQTQKPEVHTTKKRSDRLARQLQKLINAKAQWDTQAAKAEELTKMKWREARLADKGNRQGGSALKLSAPRVARRAVLMA